MWNDACRWARQRLPLMVGGELTGPDRRKAERHLIGCPNCRGRLVSLQGALTALHVAASEPALTVDAPSLWPALARQIRESRRPSPSPWSIFEPRPSWASLGIAAGVLVAAVAIVSRPLAYLQKDRGPRPAQAASEAPGSPSSGTPSREAKESPLIAEDPASSGRPEGESVAQNTAPPPANPGPPRHGPKPPPYNPNPLGEPAR